MLYREQIQTATRDQSFLWAQHPHVAQCRAVQAAVLCVLVCVGCCDQTHSLGDLHSTDLFPHSSGNWMYKNQDSGWLCLRRSLLLASVGCPCPHLAFPLCLWVFLCSPPLLRRMLIRWVIQPHLPGCTSLQALLQTVTRQCMVVKIPDYKFGEDAVQPKPITGCK